MLFVWVIIMKIYVSNSQTGTKLYMNVEPYYTIQKVMKFSIKNFGLAADSDFILARGTKFLIKDDTIESQGINDGDILDLMANPKGGKVILLGTTT